MLIPKPSSSDASTSPATGAPPGPLPVAPVVALTGFAVLVACQLAGEALVLVIRLVAPAFVFPGPVLGMLILLLVLIYLGHLPRGLDAASGGLIGILSLLFVPSAVGIIQYGGLIAGWGGPLVLAVLISTLATLIVTVCVFVWVSRWTEPDQS